MLKFGAAQGRTGGRRADDNAFNRWGWRRRWRNGFFRRHGWRGDRRIADLIELWAADGAWSDAVRRWEESGGSATHFAYRPLDPMSPLPWNHLRTGASETALSNQWDKARAIAEAPPTTAATAALL